MFGGGSYLLGKAFFYPEAHLLQNGVPPGVTDTLCGLPPLFGWVGVSISGTRPMKF